MKKWIKNIPEGTKDSLFEECKLKRSIESSLKNGFEKMGYNEIITPSIEFFDVFYMQKTFDAENMYKLFDSKNRLLALRPDCTTPIARVVATRLKDSPLPLKLYYNQNVFRTNDNFNGKRDEITQCGVELIGEAGLDADVALILAAITSLKECVGDNFKIEIGNVGIFKSLAVQCGLSQEDFEDARAFIESKNFAALNSLLDKYGEKGARLKKLPSLFGGSEVFDEIKSEETNEILDNLKKLYDALCKKGQEKYILIDLGYVNHIDYYTGIVFRGYIDGSGQTVLSGGRYDKLLEKFGFDAPATGFAINVDAVADTILRETKINRSDAPIRIALTKGRLEKNSVALFEKVGYDCTELNDKGRKLIFKLGNANIEVVLAKANDVITYVEHGVCDIGIVGKDTIMESGKAFYEIMDLGFGKCRFALAGVKDVPFYEGYNKKVIATKYPVVARTFFDSKGMDVEIIKIEGSVELAPILKLSDAIVDIVETGSTLKENGLEIIEDIANVSARVIVNIASMKMRKKEIDEFINKVGENNA